MVKPIKFDRSDDSGDSADLQALFDSIAAGGAPAAPVLTQPDPSGDSDDLQALFDSVSAQVEAAAEPAAGGEESADEQTVYNRIGHLARNLHNSLRELGYDKSLEETARQIPDACERLNYIAQMNRQFLFSSLALQRVKAHFEGL
jgi:chemotaxis protein CheZ